MKKNLFYSVVIPVFNSQKIIKQTVDRTCSALDALEVNYEIILINDGSYDSSWSVISALASRVSSVKAVNLLRNYGQHSANLCGFKVAKGDYVITMDDDLQNPPEEIEKLINTIDDNCDLVIGEFEVKKHSFIRRVGSKIIGRLIKKVFYGDDDLVLTNFRLIRKDVIDRVCEYKSTLPYIPGLLVMFSSDRRNVLVEHHSRNSGKSNYNFRRIMKLVFSILFNYSSIPLVVMAGLGFFVSLISFILSFYYLIGSLMSGTSVPGWTTLVVMLSFFNGVLILILSIIGEYVIRMLRESGSQNSYYIKEIVE